jgi:formylglycine-generating enzyme required for sulfatase activity/tetratricopeptide (TPR) repeat protein
MRAAIKLFGHGLAQALGHESLALVTDVLVNHFTDSSLGVVRAIERAHDHAWKALAVALGGDSLVERLGRLLEPADYRGFRDSVRRLLDQTPLPAHASAEGFRAACLAEVRRLRAARRVGLAGATGRDLAQETAAFCRFHDPQRVLERSWEVVHAVADGLAPDYPTLGAFLKLPVPGAPPLLTVAFQNFLHCEICENEKLARRLQYQGMLRQGDAQQAAFASLAGSLGRIGDRFDGVLAKLDRIEEKIDETREAVDRLVELVQRLAAGPAAGARQAAHLVVSAEDNHDVDLLLQARAAYRRLPAGRQTAAGWMLIADSLSAAGLSEEAREDHERVAELADDDALKAGALFKTYRERCAAGAWEPALAAYRAACERSPAVALIPDRYRPVRILGSGAFGTVFLCNDQREDPEHQRVAVKAIHAGQLAVSIEQVFREAQSLMRIKHPAIIGVRHWDYADPAKEQRPYIVMDYFEGATLADHLARHGPLSPPDLIAVALQVAQGMKAAHDAHVLHRDLKPDNLLVRQGGDRWEVKIVDFGLAVKLALGQTQRPDGRGSRRSAQHFFTGTFRYAPPEQYGEEGGVVGRHSDVYSFGKTFCEALFGTTEPRSWDFATLPAGLSALGQLLEHCIACPLARRLPDFSQVLAVLEPLARRGRAGAPQTERLSAAELRLTLQADAGEPPAGGRLPGEELVLRAQPRGRTLFRWGGAQPLAVRFVFVPPGRFVMGSPPGEPLRSPQETQRPVRLTRGFFLAAAPVTRGQFRAFVQASGYKPRSDLDGAALCALPHDQLEAGAGWQAPRFPQTDAHPVTCVSWADATAFCDWLAGATGQAVRLPSEAEWEYACRAGAATPFSFGETTLASQANYNGAASYPGGRRGEFRRGTTPAGAFPANAWGLLDMHGNVREWCQDGYRDVLPDAEAVDPVEKAAGNRRVTRGGSWNDPPQNCRCAARGWQIDTTCCDTVGFRVAFAAP